MFDLLGVRGDAVEGTGARQTVPRAPRRSRLRLFLDEQGAAYSFCGTVTPYVQLLLYASPIALSCALL